MPLRIPFLLYFFGCLNLYLQGTVNNDELVPSHRWIHHHYFAMAMSLVGLTWGIEGPDCAKKQVVNFHLFHSSKNVKDLPEILYHSLNS